MRVTLATLLTLVAYVAAQAADPSINTPAQLVQCQPAQITWTGTSPPFFVSIIPGGQPGAAALHDFGQQTGNSLTWNVNIPAGQQITFQCRDSQGKVGYSAPANIQSSSDSSCLGQNPSTSPGGSSAPASTSAPPETSGGASASSVASSIVSSASTSAAASTSAVASSSSAAVSTSSRASATAPGSTSRSASATSASPSASAAPNSARSNAKVGFAGLLGLAAAVVMA
ncbi:hypothetical protein FRC12_002421 [Ceratobasidium sp. 428]|nr:hypothetical protein FRC12_002421 [Ceratobasidium sp. 428]